MQDLIKESVSEFEEKFDAFPENPIDYMIKKEIIDSIKDWHTKQMEKAYNKGRQETIKIIQEELNRFRQGEIGDLIASLPYIVDRETGNLKILKD